MRWLLSTLLFACPFACFADSCDSEQSTRHNAGQEIGSRREAVTRLQSSISSEQTLRNTTLQSERESILHTLAAFQNALSINSDVRELMTGILPVLQELMTASSQLEEINTQMQKFVDSDSGMSLSEAFDQAFLSSELKARLGAKEGAALQQLLLQLSVMEGATSEWQKQMLELRKEIRLPDAKIASAYLKKLIDFRERIELSNLNIGTEIKFHELKLEENKKKTDESSGREVQMQGELNSHQAEIARIGETIPRLDAAVSRCLRKVQRANDRAPK